MLQKKFTLIELITVIVVISILATIVLVNIAKIKDKAITSFVESSTRSLQTSVDMYFLQEEKYPTLNNSELTVGTPQYLDVEKLVKEGFVKKDIDLSKVSKQHYWIDVFGRVWGSTEPTIEKSSLVTNSDGITQTLTVSVSENYEKLVLYKVTNGKIVTAAELSMSNLWASKEVDTKSGNKVTYKKLNEWDTKDNMKVLIEISDPRDIYLVGAVDKFHLETVPVGAGYDSEDFPVIRGQVGEFEYKIESMSVKKWIDFITLEDTPSDSKIEYKFAVKESKYGEYSEWTNDFYALPNAYGIKVSVKMTAGLDGIRPSLYDLRVLYTIEKEDKKYSKPVLAAPIEENDKKPQIKEKAPSTGNGTTTTSVIPNFCYTGNIHTYKDGNKTRLVYFYYLEEGQSISEIIPAKASNKNLNLISLTIEAMKEGGSYTTLSSYVEVESESCVRLTYVFEGDERSSYINEPFVGTVPEKTADSTVGRVTPNDESITPNLDNEKAEKDPNNPTSGIPNGPLSSDKELNDDNWVTILDFRLFQQGSGVSTIWYNYSSKQQEEKGKTRVLYRFARGNGYYWTGESEQFPENKSSNELMVHVYLQVHKDYMNDASVPDPLFESIKIYSSDGNYDLDADRPQLLIYPMKDNNLNRSTISDASKITWHYLAEDPNGFKVTDVEWSPAYTGEEITYKLGKNSIKARVKNEIGIWSNWVTYHFEVLPEKPIANFIVNEDVSYVGFNEIVKFDTSVSIDPDGDEIVNYEWRNKKESYTKSDEGDVVVSLRVQDSEGYWSDWVEKTIIVYDKDNDLWNVNGEPAIPTGYFNVFDEDNSSRFYFNERTFEVTWNRDISGKTIFVRGEGTPSFYDKNGNMLNTLQEDGTFSSVIKSSNGLVSTKLVIPDNAVKMIVNQITGGKSWSFSSIHLVDETANFQDFNSFNLSAKSYQATANWLKPTSIATVYFINTELNASYSSKTNTITLTGLTPNTKYTYRVIGVDSNFNVKTSFIQEFTTEDVEVHFDGLEQTAFDGNSSTNATIPVEGADITWSKDISGETLLLRGGSHYISFYDKDGNDLFFLNDSSGYLKMATSRDLSTISFIVPDNAVRMNIKPYYGGTGFVADIILVNYKKRLSNLTNVSLSGSIYSIDATWKNPSSVSQVYVISEGTGQSISSKISPAKLDTLEPNKNYDITVIGVDSNFNSTMPVKLNARTKPEEVSFSGLSINALDNNASTKQIIDADSITVTPSKDISGRTLYIRGNGLYVTFRDGNGNLLNTFSEIGYSNNTIVTSGTNFIIPEGTESINLQRRYSYNKLEISSFNLLEFNKPSELQNLKFTPTTDRISISWTKGADIKTTYVINEITGKMLNTSNSTINMSSLKAGTEYTFKIIAVDKNFNATVITEKVSTLP